MYIYLWVRLISARVGYHPFLSIALCLLASDSQEVNVTGIVMHFPSSLQVEKEVRQRVMAEANSKHQLEISCLKEDLRGSERLRHLANNNWTEEKDVLMNIIRQLTSTITMDLTSTGTSRPSRHTTSALSGVY